MLPIVERVAAWLARGDATYELMSLTGPVAGNENEVLLGGVTVKTVVIVSDGDYALLVTPADQSIDWRSLSEQLGAMRVRPASQSEVERLFPDCDADAIPALGVLYGVPLYLSESLRGACEIAFPVGKRGTLAKTSLATFERLAHPYWLNAPGGPSGGA